MFRATAILAAALLLAACGDPEEGGGEAGQAEAGGSGGIADGVYPCSYNSGGSLYGLGAITIDGNRYGGFTGGMRGTYSMSAEGGIAFSDGFEGTPDGFRVDGTVLRNIDGTGEPFIEMGIVSPSGNVLTVSCEQ